MRLAKIALVMLAFACGRAVLAQQATPWIDFAPPDQSFHIAMPQQPTAESVTAAYDLLRVQGAWYSAGNKDESYAIWMLTEPKPVIGWDEESYLDLAADLFWQEILKPARETLRDQNRIGGIAYVKELPVNELPGREYSVALGDLTGTTHIFVAQQKIFILLAANSLNGPRERERFLSSFKVSAQVKPIQQYGDPKGLKVTDDDPVIGIRDVDQKPRVLEKPEPTYTDSARTFGIKGTVVLRALFSKTGEVTRVEIIKRLPHGMTDRCVRAARAIKFSPAMKGGQPVSTWMQLEYNFNLY